MNQSNQPTSDQEAYRDRIATVDASGKRLWIYPKKPVGRFYEARKYVSYALLLILFGLPFIHVNGEPLVLLNILERRFILFGLHFTPQDFHLFVLAMLTFIVFIALFTVVFGRLFCGWVCPQTIFMEMVFRRIEYWIEGDANAQRRLSKAPWSTDKILKKTAKQGIFVLISVLIAHTFLAYLVGLERVFEIVSSPPSQNPGGFVAMVGFTGAFYLVFSRLREQVCTTICPYGRMQGVLTDEQTILVTYDYVRGEPRGKLKRDRNSRRSQPETKTKGSAKAPCENPCAACRSGESCKAETTLAQIQSALTELPAAGPERELGDCIDCSLCVQVCPTGIDIRDGVQLECINCTACMDACDAVMDKIDRPRGLIRYDSEAGIIAKQRRIFTPRAIAYSTVLLLLLALNTFLFLQRGDLELLIQRTPGLLYQEVDENYVSNLYNYQVINKTQRDIPLEFRLAAGTPGRIRLVGQPPHADEDDLVKGTFFIEMERDAVDRRKKVTVEIYRREDGELVDRVRTSFLGPN